MCYGCWVEEGSPREDTPELRALAERFSAADEFGACHIVVADWNLEDGSLAFCLGPSNSSDKALTEDERSLLTALSSLSVRERYSVAAMAGGFF